jgi:hypothetical protein
MEFQCSSCGYTSPKRANVIKHFDRKKSCGNETKTIIEVPIEIKCEYCDKNFATMQNLKEHAKNNCKHKDKFLKEQIKRLEEENKALKEAQNQVTNITNNTNFIIVVNNYEDTNLEKLTDKTYSKIIKNAEEGYKIIPSLIKHIHFNPDTPENHNVYISNKNGNHLQMFRNGHWEIANKESEIDNIINDKETLLSDWSNQTGNKYAEANEKYNEYLEQKYDLDTAKLVKEEVELLFYNNRHMIKN